MKQFLAIISCIICTCATAQTDSTQTADSAMLYLTGTFKKYNPQKAFTLFLQRANNSEAKAMNAVGLQYAKGLGVDSNFNMAVYWLTQAATNGYTKAYINLGMLYKQYSTDSTGYAIANNYFTLGVQQQEPSAYFALGYMYYKGLGCTQSYTEALNLFKKGIDSNRADCMYFTGLCYKYGYGVTVSADSAAYYINQAALKGYKQANAELANNNTNNNYAARGTKKIPYIQVQPLKEATTAYTAIAEQKAYIPLEGVYTGMLTQYDYSGKKIIVQMPVSIEMKATGNQLKAILHLADNEAVNVDAVQQGNTLYFSSAGFITSTIKATKKQQKLVFRKAQFTSTIKADSIYLQGSLQLYNTYTKETEKPIQIHLAKQQSSSFNIQHSTSNITVFPNPVNKRFSISFILSKATPVKITIYTTQGQLIHTQLTEPLQAGKQVISINKDIKTAGIYILHVNGNGIKESTAFIKE
ncbi:MAG: SEL1-like repeat protein [Chitinophagaceae bacterium]|nr:SEL1-like repeat protein [Chitinophagaceae bacterium]MCW5904024.1 SEL1-like repeat protein [Chitinophagaceae bacterium]